jgi:trehalose 6-phosphate phosphatase
VTAAPTVAARIAQLIAPLRSDPASAAVLCDVDGTLAPIVSDPEDAAVPPRTQATLRELARRYALVACVSGRRAVEARSLVGVDELAYAGNHGLELLTPGASEAILEPAIEEGGRAVRQFVHDLEADALSPSRLRLEDKGPIQALHWRGASDEEAAERRARRIADEARQAGLEPHWGRKVLEIRPASGIDKGTAVQRLLADHRIEQALFAGDDRTDLDAFRALRSLVDAGRLRGAVCIGIGSSEGPPELSELADAVVDGPGEFLGVLTALAQPPDGASGAPRG